MGAGPKWGDTWNDLHGTHRVRRFGALLFVLAALVAAIGVVAPATAAQAQTPPASYVALGDSYTAGPLIPNQQPDPLGCLRSDRNYPHLVAPATGPAGVPRRQLQRGRHRRHDRSPRRRPPGPTPRSSTPSTPTPGW